MIPFLTALVCLTAFAVSAIVTAGAAAAGPRHAPVARSSHTKPTPVSGGLGPVAGASAGLALAAVAGGLGGDGALRWSAAWAVCAGFAAVGALDDILELGARLKFAICAVLAVALVAALGAPSGLPVTDAAPGRLWGPLAWAGAVLWVFTATNGVNFMDGANGLIGGTVAIASAGLGAAALALDAPLAGAVGFLAAAAFAGFVPFNSPRAQVFLGDVGSLFAGAVLAALGLALAQAEPAAVYLAPLAMTPLFADVLLTLAWRLRRGRSLLEAHKDHVYQLRLQAGEPHAHVAHDVWLRTGVWAGVGAVLAALIGDATSFAPVMVLALAVAVIVETGVWVITRRDLERAMLAR